MFAEGFWKDCRGDHRKVVKKIDRMIVQETLGEKVGTPESPTTLEVLALCVKHGLEPSAHDGENFFSTACMFMLETKELDMGARLRIWGDGPSPASSRVWISNDVFELCTEPTKISPDQAKLIAKMVPLGEFHCEDIAANIAEVRRIAGALADEEKEEKAAYEELEKAYWARCANDKVTAAVKAKLILIEEEEPRKSASEDEDDDEGSDSAYSEKEEEKAKEEEEEKKAEEEAEKEGSEEEKEDEEEEKKEKKKKKKEEEEEEPPKKKSKKSKN